MRYASRVQLSRSQEFIATIKRRMREMEPSEWCINTLKTLEDKLVNKQITHIRCLAIGSPSEWPNSQYQLAFLVLVAKRLSISNITAWDPLLESIDTEVFEAFGVHVSSTNPKTDTVLYYVPHGPLSLNVELGCATNLMFLGNDMKNFVVRSPVSEHQRKSIDRLALHHVTSLTVGKHDKWFLAMNDLALHII